MCVFEGIMDANFCIPILQNYLLPFILENFQFTHQFMQEKDPKHTSRLAKLFIYERL